MKIKDFKILQGQQKKLKTKLKNLKFKIEKKIKQKETKYKENF